MHKIALITLSLIACGPLPISPIDSIHVTTWRVGESGKLERKKDGQPIFQEILPDSYNYRCYSAEDDEKWRQAINDCRGSNVSE